MAVDISKAEKLIANANSTDVAKALANPDNSYAWGAWSTFVLTLLVAVFQLGVGLDFEWERIANGQFWYDFLTTNLFALLLYWIFGKLGTALERLNPEFRVVQKDVEETNKLIKSKRLQAKLEEHIGIVDLKIKLEAIRKQAYNKLNWKPKSKRWLRIQKAVQVQDLLFVEKDPIKMAEYENQLKELRFDLKAYRIKYSRLSDTQLNVGFANGISGWLTMQFSEAYEMFGKSIVIRVGTIVAGILIGVMQTYGDALTWAAFLMFFYRITMYSYNAFIGYINGRAAVSNSQMKVMKNINLFLTTFIEEQKEVA